MRSLSPGTGYSSGQPGVAFPGEGDFRGSRAAVTGGHPALWSARAEMLLCRRQSTQRTRSLAEGIGIEIVLMLCSGIGEMEKRGNKKSSCWTSSRGVYRHSENPVDRTDREIAEGTRMVLAQAGRDT